MPSFFFNDTPPTELYPLSLHDALPISSIVIHGDGSQTRDFIYLADVVDGLVAARSEEHTSELQSRLHILCPLFFLMTRRPPSSTPFPSTTLFRSLRS